MIATDDAAPRQQYRRRAFRVQAKARASTNPMRVGSDEA